MIWFGCVSYLTRRKYALCCMKIQFCKALPFNFGYLPDDGSVWQLFFSFVWWRFSCMHLKSLVFSWKYCQRRFLVWKCTGWLFFLFPVSGSLIIPCYSVDMYSNSFNRIVFLLQKGRNPVDRYDFKHEIHLSIMLIIN